MNSVPNWVWILAGIALVLVILWLVGIRVNIG